ncbi:MAG: replicative DNA helicase, partial [Candidatus Competibacteraceae bacterium]|nr:replicative DNA helicase [Candidatus Competibacteraceae bacterium]
MTDISQRELPHNYDAEQAVLGSIIIDPVAMHEVIDIVSAGDFFQQQHGEIFRGLVDLHENRIGIDILNLNNWLAEHGKYQINPLYLGELVNVVPTSINARHYAETVHGHAMRR